MKLKKFFAVMTAVLLSIPCLSGLGASAQGYNAYLFGVYGEAQENQCWKLDDVNASSTSAVVDGDGTYEVEWVMEVPLTTSGRTEFMTLGIDNLSINSYPSLNVSIDSVIIDGSEIEYTQSDAALMMEYYDSGSPDGMTRVYLKDNWAGTGVADIEEYIVINESIKVIFTVSGMGFDGSGSSTGGEDSTSSSESESQSESESEVSSESESESQSESQSEVLSESESQSESESESEVSSTSEAESSSVTSSASESEASSSVAEDDGEKDEGGVKTWMILVGVLGVGAVVAAVIVIIKIRNSRYYL